MKNQNSKITFQNGEQSKEKAIEALNALIRVNNDNIEGFERTSIESVELDLKTLFTQIISTGQKCKEELVMEIYALEQDFEHASAAQQIMIYTQKSFLKANHSHIKSLSVAFQMHKSIS